MVIIEKKVFLLEIIYFFNEIQNKNLSRKIQEGRAELSWQSIPEHFLWRVEKAFLRQSF